MFLVIDCETGGLSKDMSLLTLSGIYLDKTFTKVGDIDLSIKYDPYIIQVAALKVNHIDLITHDKVSIDLNQARKIFIASLTRQKIAGGHDKITLIGHNVKFDIDFITFWLFEDEEDKRNIHLNKRYIDTAMLAEAYKAWNLIPQEVNSLGTLAKFLCPDINLEGVHTAKRDCELTLEVFKALGRMKI